MNGAVNELTLTSRLVAELRKIPGAVVFKHADSMTPGIPDVSVTLLGSTTWLEVKVSRDGRTIKGREQQHLNVVRLSKSGHCFYVVYDLDRDLTILVKPSLKQRLDADGSVAFHGQAHDLLAEWIHAMHVTRSL